MKRAPVVNSRVAYSSVYTPTSITIHQSSLLEKQLSLGPPTTVLLYFNEVLHNGTGMAATRYCIVYITF